MFEMAGEYISLIMFAVACIVLLLGYPVAFSLAGVALAFAGIGIYFDIFNPARLNAVPSRIFGIMTNEVLVAVPLFVFMGVMLERTKIAENLLTVMGQGFGKLRGGLGLAVIFVGMLLAASTGIVGATVVTMGLLSLPAMLKAGYDPKLASGAICASGTLGQIIPPSIVLILLGDILQSAYSEAQMAQGIWAVESVSVVDLFAGAFIPGMILVVLYMGWMLLRALLKPESAPPVPITDEERKTLMRRMARVMVPPGVLILAVLGSILAGVASPTEAAAVGAAGAAILALVYKQLSRKVLMDVMQETMKISSMVFIILVGASVFSLVFRIFGGDHLVEDLLSGMPGGLFGAMLAVMALMFVMGFFLDFIEIVFVVVPIVGPVLLQMDISPVWLGVMIAINLQTSFLTPPFGFALFYLRGVAPPEVKTADIYRGVIPFVAIQLAMLCILAAIPELATWLPGRLFGD